ncbi:hypothetical protein PoHVEF18_004730 [Penicillium ochrochloron]
MPPQVSGIKKEAKEATNKTIPMDKIGDEHLRECHNASSADTLDRAADEQQGEGMCNSGEN